MLTPTTTAQPTYTPLPIPASPAEISQDTPIEELLAIKHSWAQSAREEAYADLAYDVAFGLGQEVVTHPREHVYKIWSNDNVYVLAREYAEPYRSAMGTNLTVRCLEVYIGEPDRKYPGLVEQIFLSDNMVKVLHWHWNFFGGQLTEWDDNYLIPGKWIDVLRAEETAATEVRKRSNEAQLEKERKDLLAELLAGHDV